MIKKYGLFGSVRVGISLIYTKIFFPNARLIRLPFDIRNRRLVKIGENFTTGFGCRMEAHAFKNTTLHSITIGKNVQINDYVHIAGGENISIGNDVLIASKVFITDINHGRYQGDDPDSPLTPPYDRALSTNPVRIEDNVWLGENVCVMPGSIIGKGSIIGASSVVTKNIPPYSIAVGNPAKVIKEYNFETQLWNNINKNA
jgi:acetyltransferase-like isoleucine patch superfamily enzyme